MPFVGKLGKQEPKNDPRTLRLARYLTPKLKPPPKTVDYAKNVAQWPMYANDRYGDCTCAAVGHMIQAWTQQAEGDDIAIPEQDVLAAYAAITGFDPNTGANDNGAYELDVLNYWRNTGIGGHKIGAFADAKATNHTHVKQAIYLFGGVYLGVGLPITAQGQAVWDVVDPKLKGDSAPWSWGGHAVNAVGYDRDHLWFITWGRLTAMTWRFVNAYVDEVHAVLSEDWITDASGKAPVGVDMQALIADLAAIPSKARPA